MHTTHYSVLRCRKGIIKKLCPSHTFRGVTQTTYKLILFTSINKSRQKVMLLFLNHVCIKQKKLVLC